MTVNLTSTMADLRRTARDTGYAVVGATDLAISKMWEATRTAPARAQELPDLAQTMSRQARELVEEQLGAFSQHGREVFARRPARRPAARTSGNKAAVTTVTDEDSRPVA